MQRSPHYADEDFQEFLDNHFGDNREEFEAHLRECSQCNEQFIAYRSVFSYLQTEFEPAGIEASVAKEAADRVFNNVGSISLAERVMYGLVVGIAAFAFGLCLRFFVDFSSAFPILAVALVLAGLQALLSFKEIRLMKHSLS